MVDDKQASSKIRVTLIRSGIGRPQNQRRTLAALGLSRIGRSVVLNSDPAILGMVRCVEHMVRVECVQG